MIIITSGVYSPKLLSRKDGPISLSPDEEARLVSIGVAQYANKAVEMVAPDEQASVEASCTSSTTNYTPEDKNCSEGAEAPEEEAVLEDMTYTQLKSLASDMGIKTGNLRSKQALIEAIEAERAPDLTTIGDVIV
jgi:hypothetical protein